VSPAATGVVYIFNTTNQLITLVLNGDPLPSLDAAAGKEHHFAAASFSVPRSNANKIPEAVFAEENTLNVMFQGILNKYSLTLDFTKYPSNNDLLVFIFYNYLVLIDGATNAIIQSLPPAPP
jgi:hypothetical protein